MTAVLRCGTLLALVLSCACRDSYRPPAPSPVPAQVPVPAPPPTPAPPPPVPGAVTAIYDFERPLSHPVSGYTMTSRFVLYDNGVFSLQYPGLAANYLGTYSQENESITFRFGSGTDSTATGTLKDDLLEVRYSLNMQMSDFEDGVYKRAQ